VYSRNIKYHIPDGRTMPENVENEQIPKKFLLILYSILLTLGILIYVSWGIMYGSWNILDRSNLGIYALTILLVGFGLVGIVLYSMRDDDE